MFLLGTEATAPFTLLQKSVSVQSPLGASRQIAKFQSEFWQEIDGTF